MKRLLSAFLALTIAGAVRAQTTTTETLPRAESKVGSAVRDVAGDVRLNLTNALTNTLQNSKYFDLDLKWDFLPDDPAVPALRDAYGQSWIGAKNLLWGEWKIRNKDLASPGAWQRVYDRMGPDERRFFSSVLNAGRPADLRGRSISEVLAASNRTLGQAVGRFQPLRPSDGPPTDERNLAAQTAFAPVANYRFCLAMLKALVDSRGMGLKVEPDEDAKGLVLNGSRYLRDEIEWTIRAYRSQYYGEGDVPQTFTLTMSAAIRRVRFDMVVANDAAPSKVDLHLTAGLLQTIPVPQLGDDGKTQTKEFLGWVPYTVADGGTSVTAVAPNGAGELPTARTVTPSQTLLSLDIIGNVDTAQSVTEAILGNNANARLFTGGMIGNGRVRRVLGVNMVAPRSPFGFLYGLVTDTSNALFVGPSAQAGIFTLGVGGRIYGKANGDTSAKLAGVLSVDLARVFTRPNPPETVRFAPQDASASFWGAFPDSAKNGLVATLGFQPDAALTQDVTVTFRQETDPAGNAVANGRSFTFVVPKGGRWWTTRLLLPLGRYTLELPPGVAAKLANEQGAAVDDVDGPIDLTTGATTALRLKLVPAAGG